MLLVLPESIPSPNEGRCPSCVLGDGSGAAAQFSLALLLSEAAASFHRDGRPTALTQWPVDWTGAERDEACTALQGSGNRGAQGRVALLTLLRLCSALLPSCGQLLASLSPAAAAIAQRLSSHCGALRPVDSTQNSITCAHVERRCSCS